MGLTYIGGIGIKCAKLRGGNWQVLPKYHMQNREVILCPLLKAQG